MTSTSLAPWLRSAVATGMIDSASGAISRPTILAAIVERTVLSVVAPMMPILMPATSSIVDAQADQDGRFRVVVVPDPEDPTWPDRRYLRQGVRANGWCLLDTVSVGFELWRNLNAFPPSVEKAPDPGLRKGKAATTKGAKKGSS